MERKTKNNKHYRKVIYTDKHIQVVLMSLEVGEFIHKEKHKGTQFFRIEEGEAIANVGTSHYKLKDGDTLIVPSNTQHEIIQSGNKVLKLYTIYSPPVHSKHEKNWSQPLDDD